MFLYRTIEFHMLQKPFILLFEILEIELKASGIYSRAVLFNLSLA